MVVKYFILISSGLCHLCSFIISTCV